jgi:hypothetical protein
MALSVPDEGYHPPSNLCFMALSIPDEGYHRPVVCASWL